MNDELKFTIDLDQLTIGDLEKLESSNLKALLEVFEHVVVIPGVAVEEQGKALRGLPWTAIRNLGAALLAAVTEEANPVVDGKN